MTARTDSGCRMSGFKEETSGFGLHTCKRVVSGFRFMVLGLGFRVSCSRFHMEACGFGVEVLSFVFRVSCFGFQIP